MNSETKTILEIINHALSQHNHLAPTIENITQNIIYKRGPQPKNQYYALNDLDKKLEKYLNYDGGYFIELGANDGVNQSNTLYFEKQKGWRGILIEPIPHNYLLCLKNRSKNNQIFCNACVSDTYKEKFVEIIFSNLMSTPIGIESDIAEPVDHASSGSRFLKQDEEIFTFGAVATTLTKILEKSNAPKSIDLLSLDVEGAEIEVLKGINHNIYRFKYMLIECRNIEKLNIFLEGNGYELVDTLSIHDYLFRDKNCNRGNKADVAQQK